MSRRLANPLFSLIILILTLSHPLLGQQSTLDAGRRVMVRVTPTYPELARRTNFSGIVKLDVLIAPDGKVKSTEVVGGNPILVQAAVEAVRKWKYEPSAEETRERIELRFAPTSR